jgi:hypothetical protein
MKKLCMNYCHSIRTLTAATRAVLALGSVNASAQTAIAPPPPYIADPDHDLGFYLNGDIGPSFMPNFQSARFGSPGTFSLRPGAGFGIEPGYDFLNVNPFALGVNFDTGVIYNQIRHLNMGGATFYHGDYYQVPILGGLELKIHTGTFVVPYIGVGGGGDYSWARIHSRGVTTFGYETHSDEIDPAVQGEVGFASRWTPAFRSA